MAYGAGRTTKLKFGMSVMVLPGRNPVVLAKELATLASMSAGRLLPAFGLGAVDPIEQQAFGVERNERAAIFDETLEVMRKCWTGEPFAHDGPRFTYDGVVRAARTEADGRVARWHRTVRTEACRSTRRRLACRRSSCPPTPRPGASTIEQVCVEHDREIEDDHYGVLIPYSFGDVPEPYSNGCSRSVDPTSTTSRELVPDSWDLAAGD